MTIDITVFHFINIIDSCAIWNLLSSNRLYISSINANCNYTITKFIEYECLFKTRNRTTTSDTEIIKILTQEIAKGSFQSHNLTIDDLQEISDLSKMKKLGNGELSAIAFARKTNLAFMTDDQNARKLATNILGKGKVQTTAHLLGWLIFRNHLSDSDVELIIAEHKLNERPLERYFREVYYEAMRIKCISR